MARKKTTTIAEERVGIRLSSHEKICAERMKNLLTSIERLEKKVDTLSDSVSKGKGIVANSSCTSFFRYNVSRSFRLF
jgi:hypothetical protein